jgi:hypothetical protein
MSDGFPKTLVIRNEPGGMIWQVYHVQNNSEADLLKSNADRNGFYGVSLEEYQPELKETWPDWRETGKALVEKAKEMEKSLKTSTQ